MSINLQRGDHSFKHHDLYRGHKPHKNHQKEQAAHAKYRINDASKLTPHIKNHVRRQAFHLEEHEAFTEDIKDKAVKLYFETSDDKDLNTVRALLFSKEGLKKFDDPSSWKPKIEARERLREVVLQPEQLAELHRKLSKMEDDLFDKNSKGLTNPEDFEYMLEKVQKRINILEKVFSLHDYTYNVLRDTNNNAATISESVIVIFIAFCLALLYRKMH